MPHEFSAPSTALRCTALMLLCVSCKVVFGYTHQSTLTLTLPVPVLGSVHRGSHPRSRGSRYFLSATAKQRSAVAEPPPTFLPSITERLTSTKEAKTKKSKKGIPRKPPGKEKETVELTQTKSKKRTKKANIPTHWIVESDEVSFRHMDELDRPTVVSPLSSSSSLSLSSESLNATTGTALSESTQMNVLLRFTVRGNPLPLRRHRTSRGFVYNPSAASQKTFREAVEQIVFTNDTTTAHELDPNRRALPVLNQPLWGPEQVLAVTIVFRMKRPNNHFISGKRGHNRLRPTAPSQTSGNLRTDVDNLAKFVLDSLNGVLYTDDRQIASLHVTKLFDDDVDELCMGSTCVSVRLLREKDVSRLLANSLDSW